MSRLKTTLKHVLGKTASEEEYLLAQGFRHGRNYQCYSPYAIDANWPWLITIGDNVTIASNVKILAHDASTSKVGCHTKIGIVEIENNVFIGAGSIVLCNTRIGDNVIIGAGSVVTHDCPSDAVYAGNPAKFICSFEEYTSKHQANQNDHPIFRQHTWKEWPNVSIDEKTKMREQLKDTFGYL